MDPQTTAALTSLREAIDTLWLVVTTSLLFLVVAGYGLFEAGSIRRKNSSRILVKNLLVSSSAALGFWILGYGFAFGRGSFVGTDSFLLFGSSAFAHFSFQWTVTTLICVITSASVCERVRFWVFIAFPAFFSAFSYPFLAHWFFSADGFLSPFSEEPFLANGLLDVSGSGTLHILAGISGLIFVLIVGPRYGRFEADSKTNEIPGHNLAMASLGVFFVWQAFVFFSAQTSDALTPLSNTFLSSTNGSMAARGAINVMIGSAAGGGISYITTLIRSSQFDLPFVLQGIIAGIVSVGSGASLVDSWAAFLIACVGSILYIFGSLLMRRVRIDDALDVIPVHAFCGIWSMLSVGLFARKELAESFYGNFFKNNGFGILFGGDVEQLAAQFLGVILIAGWGCLCSVVFFLPLHRIFGLRVSDDRELQGSDFQQEHDRDSLDQPKAPPAASSVQVKGLRSPSTKNRYSAQVVGLSRSGSAHDSPMKRYVHKAEVNDSSDVPKDTVTEFERELDEAMRMAVQDASQLEPSVVNTETTSTEESGAGIGWPISQTVSQHMERAFRDTSL